jgi:hypothetical protein
MSGRPLQWALPLGGGRYKKKRIGSAGSPPTPLNPPDASVNNPWKIRFLNKSLEETREPANALEPVREFVRVTIERGRPRPKPR